jgi:ribose 5-phosphate isomerase B
VTKASDETLFFGADHAGLELKDALAQRARSRGLEVVDLGTHDAASTDYPDFAHEVSRRVARGEGRGVLICGTGIGMSMAANRHPGVRAALCAEPFGARMTRRHNDANVLCLGARLTGPGLAEEIFDVFLDTPFEGGRHARRVSKIDPESA